MQLLLELEEPLHSELLFQILAEEVVVEGGGARRDNGARGRVIPMPLTHRCAPLRDF